MKIVLAQYWTDNLTYSKYTQAINEAYCKEKGYIYEVETDSNLIKTAIKDRSITWFKPKFILDTLEKHNPDFILFVDADAVVLNDNHSIEDFIIDGIDIVATEDYGPSKLNAGVLLIKNTAWSKDFLNKWWEICEEYPQYKTGLWHDQTCFGLLMDRTSDLTSHIKIINPNILNARAENKECFIFHAFAYGNIPCRTLDKVYYQKFNLPVPASYKDSLVDLAQFYGTDKHFGHNYISSVYSKVFLPIKDSVKLFVEIGVHQGTSLKMWRDYFTNARIVGVDTNQSQVEGCEVIACDQSNSEQLVVVKEVIQDADIILDDGTHKMLDQQKTLAVLFKSLKPGGVFILEDLHTSIECKMPDKAWCGWGDPDKTTTLDMLENFINNKTIKSDYLSDEESKYLENNISDVKIYKVNPMSITSIICKYKKPIMIENSNINNAQRESMSDIAKIYPTDKDFTHNYFNLVYEKYFSPIRDDVKRVCEIGVGGFWQAAGWVPGNSLKVWDKYFPNAEILGLDINSFDLTSHGKVTVDYIDQSNKELVEKYSLKLTEYDIIIDDGSHVTYDQQITMAAFFKSLKSDGIFVMEDLHSSLEVIVPEKNSIWGWGDPTKITTLEMLESFKNTGKIISDYLSDEEKLYLENNIKSIEIFHLAPTSVTSIIYKK